MIVGVPSMFDEVELNLPLILLNEPCLAGMYMACDVVTNIGFITRIQYVCAVGDCQHALEMQ